ncbi:MAG: pyruvate dehydrogenase (acetyl-transferring) E1 component subunit alpha [Nocardiaceae bacterium]|nr:pyruvate dehydrogenase (acetyl-transferring) E1 component subunit alpha [Nocardiaceae bacterium]
MSVKSTYPVQLIQPDGRRVLNREYSRMVSDIGPTQLRQLYEDLVVVRRIDAEATALQRQGELSLWVPLLGQEAAQVGSAHALEPDDFVFQSYRETGVAYCRGVAPSDILPMWRGATLSNWDPYEFNITNPGIVVGSQGLHATGYAYGAHLDGADIAVMTYFGDGATSQGDMAEAMVFASTWSVPLVFFCQNNHWAISVPVTTQSSTPLAQRATGYGIPSVQVDGNDVLAVLAVTRMAVQHVREGNGPFYIEALTYRMGPHTTSDDPTRYRAQAELEIWKARDPILRLRRLLENEGFFDAEFESRIQEKADAIAADLRAATIALETPAPLTMFDHVYSTPHSFLEDARAEYATFLSDGEEVAS